MITCSLSSYPEGEKPSPKSKRCHSDTSIRSEAKGTRACAQPKTSGGRTPSASPSSSSLRKKPHCTHTQSQQPMFRRASHDVGDGVQLPTCVPGTHVHHHSLACSPQKVGCTSTSWARTPACTCWRTTPYIVQVPTLWKVLVPTKHSQCRTPLRLLFIFFYLFFSFFL